MKPKLLAFAGSTRTGSFNKKLIRVAADAARSAGAEVTRIDLRDFPMPLYDGDLENEQGIPEHAVKLRELMIAHDGFLISTPEYNSSTPAVLKNAIDWASRQGAPDEPVLVCFTGKVAGLMSASPGGLGGLRSLTHLRQLLSNIHVMVIPEQRALARAHEAFNDDGSLKDKAQHDAITKIAQRLVEITARLKA